MGTAEPDTNEPHDLEQLLDRMNETAANGEGKVSLDAIIDAVGTRSFGPLLLLCGIIAMSPISGIPGLPTAIGILVTLTGGQLLFGRRHFWLPQWLLRRQISQKAFCKVVHGARPVARAVDRLLRPRLTALTRGAGAYLIAIICVLVAATMPPLELVPFLASVAGTVLATSGLALIANDGLVCMFALLLTGTGIVATVLQLTGG